MKDGENRPEERTYDDDRIQPGVYYADGRREPLPPGFSGEGKVVGSEGRSESVSEQIERMEGEVRRGERPASVGLYAEDAPSDYRFPVYGYFVRDDRVFLPLGQMISEFSRRAVEIREEHGRPVPRLDAETGLIPPDRVLFTETTVMEELAELREAKTLAGQVDAILDLIYFAAESLVSLGINPDIPMLAVHRANMRKVTGPGVKEPREDGKIMKPEGWTGPDAEIEAWLSGVQREIAGSDAPISDILASVFAPYHAEFLDLASEVNLAGLPRLLEVAHRMNIKFHVTPGTETVGVNIATNGFETGTPDGREITLSVGIPPVEIAEVGFVVYVLRKTFGQVYHTLMRMAEEE